MSIAAGREVVRQLRTVDRNGVIEVNGGDVCQQIPRAMTDPKYGLYNPQYLIPQLLAAVNQLDAAVTALTVRLDALESRR